ncbi:hypothetical protein MKEN_01330800 [Mycena kentingensis (nom. inval.)]|nr:hypothetical protein MKEN_01330800 [Mycena kentingensis (nom. inval.)]
MIEERPSSSEFELGTYSTPIRVLVVGAEGAGKSTIINHILGRNNAISHHTAERGWDLALGLSSLRNPGLVLHELQCPHSLDRSERLVQVAKFLQSNRAEAALENQANVIWFCVPIPSGETRDKLALTPTEIEFLSSQQVPRIAIFTKFERLVSLLEDQLSLPDNSTEEETEALSMQRANVRFQETSSGPLGSMAPAVPYVRTFGLDQDFLAAEPERILANLVLMTRTLANEHLRQQSLAGTSIKSVSAKLEASIDLGMSGGTSTGLQSKLMKYRVYYRAMLTNLFPAQLEDIIDKLHRRTTRLWNLDDPHVRRDSVPLMLEIRRISFFSPPGNGSAGVSWTDALDRYQILISLLLGSGITVTLGPAVAAFVLCFWLAQILFRMARRIPETVRAYLEYTIHLTLILDRIFLNSLTSPHTGRPHPLSTGDIDSALEEYTNSEAAAQVHSEVQLFVDHACESIWRMWRGLRKDRVEELVRELVQRWRMNVESNRAGQV